MVEEKPGKDDVARKRGATPHGRAKPGAGWHGDPEGHAAAGRKGGQVAHERGSAHEFTPEEAREAGRKGGLQISRDRQHMAEIGRRGGEARSRNR